MSRKRNVPASLRRDCRKFFRRLGGLLMESGVLSDAAIAHSMVLAQVALRRDQADTLAISLVEIVSLIAKRTTVDAEHVDVVKWPATMNRAACAEVGLWSRAQYEAARLAYRTTRWVELHPPASPSREVPP